MAERPAAPLDHAPVGKMWVAATRPHASSPDIRVPYWILMEYSPMPDSQPGRVMWWCSASVALSLGCTHHARFLGIIPGFYNPDTALWVSRSDLLNPVEDALMWCWATLRRLRGEDPDFMFALGKPIADERRNGHGHG